MSRLLRALTLFVALCSSTEVWAADWPADLTLVKTLQGVNGSGGPAFSVDNFPIRFQGIVLNDPAKMLDSTPNYLPWTPQNTWNLGAQWQIFVQSDQPGDFGGVALYMAQNYGNVDWLRDSSGSYQDVEWLAELDRLTSNGTLRKGDRVEVRARAGSPYGGKFNVNERHDNSSDSDFEIEILQAGAGLPAPHLVSLSELKSEADSFLFDVTRATGNEHYQGRLVQFSSVSLVAPDLWAPGARLLVTDGLRTFPLHLGIDPGFAAMAAPSGAFNVVGIFNQESQSGQDGYELWVMDPEAIVAVPEPAAIVLAAIGALGLLARCRRGSRFSNC